MKKKDNDEGHDGKIMNFNTHDINPNDSSNNNSLEKKDETKYFKVNKKSKVHLIPTVNLRSFLIFFGISIIVIAVIFMMLLPSAKIIINPKTEPFTTSFDVVISSNIENIDIDNLLIPGESIENEEKSEKRKYKATGERNIGEKAKGDITIYNGYSSDPITLVASTRFVSSNKVFYTLQEITIPGASIEGGETIAGNAKVRVEAEAEGDEYNIGPSNFIIPNLSSARQQDIYGESFNNFSGGSSRIVQIVSEEDYENAKNDLFQSTFDNMIEALSNKINEEKLLAAGIMKKEITEINSSPGVGEETDEFDLDIKVKVTGYIVKRNDIAVLINNKFTELVPTDKYILNDDVSDGILFEPIEGIVSDEDSITAKINITKQVAWKQDDKKIKDEIKGYSPEKAREYLEQDDSIITSGIELWPFWVQTIPKSTKKIEIELDTEYNGDKIQLN